MQKMSPTVAAPLHRVGRPRRGTESARAASLIAAATRVFLREGYGSASIDKVASEAGISTRTIYERFKNKADLLGAVISRLVDRDMASVLATGDLDRLEPRQALTLIGQTVTGQACSPDSPPLLPPSPPPPHPPPPPPPPPPKYPTPPPPAPPTTHPPQNPQTPPPTPTTTAPS